MPRTSRRSVLTGAAGLAAGSALALSTPLLAQPEPFRIEPSANYIELQRLTVLINEAHRLRYWAPNVGKAEAKRLGGEVMTYWQQIQALLAQMSSQAPRTPSDLLDYAAVMLWHSTGGLGGGLIKDPCEALAQATEYATQRQYSSLQVAWGIFALAADRTQPAADWPECRPPMLDGPGTDI
jgi:hypothetical protein